MATIDKELLKLVVSAKTPRNYLFAEGSEDKILVVSKAKISKEEKDDAEKRSKGKTTSQGKLVLEKDNEGNQKVVFLMKKPNESLIPKFRRALKQQAGLSKTIEVRQIKPEEEEDDKPIDVVAELEGDGKQVKKAKAPPVSLEKQYREMETKLREEVEALKLLNPKAAGIVLNKLREAETKVGGAHLDDTTRFKDAVKALKALTSTVAKLPRKASDEQTSVSNRATFKSLRERINYQCYNVASVDTGTTGEAIALLHEADALVADSVPEGDRDYKKAMKLLASAKKLLDKRETAAKKHGEELVVKKGSDQPLNIFKKKKQEVKTLLQQFADKCPQAKELPGYHKVIADANEQSRMFQYGATDTLLDNLKEEIQKAIDKYDNAAVVLKNTKEVLHQARTVTAPQFPPNLLKTYVEFMQNADVLMKANKLDGALGGAKDLDDRIRQTLAQRKMFRDSVQSTNKLLDAAFVNLEENVARGFEKRYTDSFVTFENGDFTGAYDQVTKVEADLQNLLRKLPQDVKPPKSGNVDGTSQAPEIMQGKSERARKMKFKLNLDNVRRTFPLLSEKAPEDLIDFEKWLQIVLEKEESDFNDAESELELLVKDLNSTVASARFLMPITNRKTPGGPPRPTRPAPRMTREMWKSRIATDKLVFDPKKKLGQGGEGAIYQLDSTDPKTPPLVMKVPGGTQGDSTKGLEKEASNYDLAGDHPNIIKSFGMTEVGGKKGLVLEQVKGTGFDNVTGNLKTRLAKGEISQNEFWGSIQYTLGKTLGVLDHLHDKGLVHNDIKPENIMIDQTTGDVKVIDLGTLTKVTGNPGETSPVYRAPEMGKSGATPQTDVFSTGASTFDVGEGETFGYGDKEGIAKAGFKFQIEKIVEEYAKFIGTDDEDQRAIKQETYDTSPNEQVDEQGNPNPFGDNTKKVAGVKSSKTAYTEFVNWLLHPDPTKRPTAKQALEHPFLRDRILEESKVKDLLKNTMTETPVEQYGKEPTRKLADDGKAAMKDNNPRLKESLEIVTKFKLGEKKPAELVNLRDTIDTCLIDGVMTQRRLTNGIDALQAIVDKAVIKDSPQYYEDVKALAAMKTAKTAWDKAIPGLNRCLSGVNLALSNASGGEAPSPDKVRERLNTLINHREKIKADFELHMREGAPLYNKLQDIWGFRKQVEALQARHPREKQVAVKQLKNAPGTPGQDTPAVDIGKKFDTHIQALEQLRVQVVTGITSLEGEIDTQGFDVTRLQEEVKDLTDNLAGVIKENEAEGLKFEEEVKKPRNTQEQVANFEKARLGFEEAKERHRELFDNMREMARDFLGRARDLGLELGPVARPGMDNLPHRVATLDQQLRDAMAKMK